MVSPEDGVGKQLILHRGAHQHYLDRALRELGLYCDQDTLQPPQKGGVDPTLILVDPDATGEGDGSSGINKIDIAPIDRVRDWQLEPGSTPPPTGNDHGGDTMIGRHLP